MEESASIRTEPSSDGEEQSMTWPDSMDPIPIVRFKRGTKSTSTGLSCCVPRTDSACSMSTSSSRGIHRSTAKAEREEEGEEDEEERSTKIDAPGGGRVGDDGMDDDNDEFARHESGERGTARTATHYGTHTQTVVETSCITVCEVERPPHAVATPHALYPHSARCISSRRHPPRAAIYIPPDCECEPPCFDDGSRFAAFGATFRLCAGAVDTSLRMEAADVEIPPSGALPCMINLSSDVMVSVRSGVGSLTVNGATRPLAAGCCVYIHRGSSHAINNSSEGETLALLAVWNPPGTMGFFWEASRLQQAARQTELRIRALAAKYCLRLLHCAG
jgi:mannose-6-phosphate isomerase-like protein (cupin superfamily)